MTQPQQLKAPPSVPAILVRKAKWKQLEIPATRFSCATSGSLRPKLGLCILVSILAVATCLLVLPLLADAPAILFSSLSSTSPKMAAADNVKSVSDANTAFLGKLYSVLAKEADGGNFLVSPFSLSAVMAMLRAGARGTTAEEIEDALNFPKEEGVLESGFEGLLSALSASPGDNFTLEAANRLYVQQGYQLLDAYLSLTAKHFSAGAVNLDFSNEAQARSAINSWVEEKTHAKIKDLIPSGVLTELTRLVLVNAVYFKGLWEEQFDAKWTHDEEFTLQSGEKVKVPMMACSDRKYAATKDDALDSLVLRMPYKGERVSLFVFLPVKPEGLGALEQKFHTFDFSRLDNKTKTKMDVALPRFKLESTHALTEKLRALGASTMFDVAKADFSGISEQKDLFVSAVLQKAFVEVNEEGTEAAAATGAIMMTRMMVIKERFVCDRPFLFAIRDAQTGVILFAGRVMDPTKN